MTEVTTPIDVIVHHDVQGSPIDREGFPFDLSSTTIPGIVAETLANHPLPLSQISSLHARSYEIGAGISPVALWGDKYGNRYTSVTFKGNNFSKPGVMKSATAPSGFIPYGLQEGDALYRVAQASALLRRHRIPTEWIVGFFEPTEMPFNGDERNRLTQQDYKRKLVEVAIRGSDADEAATVRDAIMPMKFYVTARAMEIGDRPFDFSADETADDVKKRLDKIFSVYNLTHRTDPEFQALDAARTDDMIYYFSSLLPRLRGANLARLHQIGIAHRFPVYGNTTALGGIIDLDSAHGEPLGVGDPPIDESDVFNDMLHAFDPDYELSVLIHLQTLFPDEINVAELYSVSIQEFIDSYLNVYDEDTGTMSRRALLAYGAVIAASFNSAYKGARLPKNMIKHFLDIARAHLTPSAIEQYSAMVNKRMSASALDYVNGLHLDNKYQMVDTAICEALVELQNKIDSNDDIKPTAEKFYAKFAKVAIDDLRLNIAYHLLGEMDSICTIVRSSIIDTFKGLDDAEDKSLHIALTSSLIDTYTAPVIQSILTSPEFLAIVDSLVSLCELGPSPRLITENETAEYSDVAIFKGRILSICQKQDLGQLTEQLRNRPGVEIKYTTIESLHQLGIMTSDDIVQIISDASTVFARGILSDDTYSLQIETDNVKMESYVSVVTSRADASGDRRYVAYICLPHTHEEASL